MFDPLSSEGRQLLKALDERIEEKRTALERPLHDHNQTQFLRGQIKALRWVVGLIRGEPEDDG